MIRFDYLNNDKTTLSADGKKPALVLQKGFKDADIFIGMGKGGRLKGKAFEDYLKIAQDNRLNSK